MYILIYSIEEHLVVFFFAAGTFLFCFPLILLPRGATQPVTIPLRWHTHMRTSDITNLTTLSALS